MSREETSIKAKVAVAGAGYWGKNLVRNFHALGALGAVCDSNSKTQAAFREQYPQVPVYPSLEEAFTADPSINATALATPAQTHYALVEQCLAAGKHVFVEKPLCLDAADGERLVALARRAGLTLMVGHLLQYHPAARKLKEMISAGDLGRLQYIYSNRLNLGKIRTEENILWSFAPHDISLILAYAGQAPTSVAAFGSHFLNKSVADVTVSALTFPSGVSAHLFVSWLHPFKEQKLVVVGDAGMAVFNDASAENKLLFYPHSVKWKDGIPTPDKKDAAPIAHDTLEPLREECAHFLRCVETGETPVTDGEEGLRVLRVLAACQKSMETGGAVVTLDRAPAPSKPAAQPYFAHQTAALDDGVEIGEGTKIWHFSHILKNSIVGKNCNIGQNVVIGPDVTVGDGCKIQNNVSVYKGVTLENNVFCGPSMVFTNVYNPRANIKRMDELRPTLVREGATIGANSTIMCGITLGRYCLVAAGAMVLRDVPDHALVAGNPATQKGWMCQCCVRLTGAGKRLKCPSCGRKYKLAKAGLEPAE